jgi:hypothetical protein
MDYDDLHQRTDEHPDFIITIGPARLVAPAGRCSNYLDKLETHLSGQTTKLGTTKGVFRVSREG